MLTTYIFQFKTDRNAIRSTLTVFLRVVFFNNIVRREDIRKLMVTVVDDARGKKRTKVNNLSDLYNAAELFYTLLYLYRKASGRPEYGLSNPRGVVYSCKGFSIALHPIYKILSSVRFESR